MNIATPTILTVYNSKGKPISSAVIDYDSIDTTHESIKELCEKNQWYYQLTVPPVWEVFISNLKKLSNEQ